MTATTGTRDEPRSVIEQARRAERTGALRYLVVQPLVLQRDNEEMFQAIVRHRAWLERWCADNPSWKLIVDRAAGFARLHKVPAKWDNTRPARLAGKAGRAFDQRRYVLLCLTLAALADTAGQTTLARLAEQVEGLSREEPVIAPFEPSRHIERRAFVDALRWLMEVGVLGLRDGDTELYARSREGNALYDVNDRLIGQLIAAPRPPALAAGPQELLLEVYPDTDEGEKLRARHTAMRRLIDDPVVYYDDLDPGAYHWLHQSRGFVYRLLEEDLGLGVERYKEGLAAVDPEGEVSDEVFPDGGSTVKHAALLLAEQLARRAKERHPEVAGKLADEVADKLADEVAGKLADEVAVEVADKLAVEVIDEVELGRIVGLLINDYGARCHWSKQYMDGPDGAALLAGDAIALLVAFGLVSRVAGGWLSRPAIGHIAPVLSGA